MSVPAGGGYPYQGYPAQIDFGWIGRGWDIFKAQAGVWMGAAALFILIVLIISIPLAFVTGFAPMMISFVRTVSRSSSSSSPPPEFFASMAGVYGTEFLWIIATSTLGYALLGGLYRMALRAARGETVGVADFLSVADVIWPLLGVGLVTYVCITIGSLLFVLPGLVVGGLFMFAPLLVVDRRLGAIEAITESIRLLKSQWLMASLFYFVVALLCSFSVYLCGVGILVGLPVYYLSITVGYLAFTRGVAPPPAVAPSYGPPTAGVWPPPPNAGQSPPPGYPPGNPPQS